MVVVAVSIVGAVATAPIVPETMLLMPEIVSRSATRAVAKLPEETAVAMLLLIVSADSVMPAGTLITAATATEPADNVTVTCAASMPSPAVLAAFSLHFSSNEAFTVGFAVRSSTFTPDIVKPNEIVATGASVTVVVVVPSTTAIVVVVTSTAATVVVVVFIAVVVVFAIIVVVVAGAGVVVTAIVVVVVIAAVEVDAFDAFDAFVAFWLTVKTPC